MYKLALTIVALALLTSCQSPPATRKSAKPPPAPAAATVPKVEYSEKYDKQIKAIMALAGQGMWEEARTQATALCAQDPDNAMLQRLQSWVTQEGEQIRAKALEDSIRKVDAQNSPFNQTIPGLLKEQKDQGLPPRKDIRDAVDRIENTPWIPGTYDKTIREKGPLFELDATNGPTATILEKPVTIHLDNVPLETLIVQLSQSAGVNMVTDKSLPALKQVLSVNVDKVKLGEFLRYLGRNYEVQFQVGRDLVWVVDAKDVKKLVEETRFYKLRKGFLLPAQFAPTEITTQTVTTGPTKTVNETQKSTKFVNDEVPPMPALERAITNLFTGSKYMIDYERNLVVARGTPEQLDVLENIIREFDKPIQQVLIESRFVTITKPAFEQLGVLWQNSSTHTGENAAQDFTGITGGGNFPVAAATGNPAVGIGIQQTFYNVLGASNLTATISALEQSGESQTLSAPRLTVVNNQPATISDGQVQYYYEEYQVATTVGQYYTSSTWVPSGKPTKITAGAVLNVMASISGDGRSIVLALNPIVNSAVQLVRYTTLNQVGVDTNLVSSFDIKLPTYRTSEISTRAVVKSGETVVMGGVLEREKSTYVESVPVLGNIPIIGVFFRRRTEVDSPRYLLVFVTATIVTDTGEFLIYNDQPRTNNIPAK